MVEVNVHDESITLDEPMLVEGFPGIGLAGKIVTDHLLDEGEFVHYASVHCETLQQISVYHKGDRTVRAPLRMYADPDGSLLILSSDIPVKLDKSGSFVECLTAWFDRNEVFPIFLSGRPRQSKQQDANVDPRVFGVASGSGLDRLDDLDLSIPDENGAISGPTGALLLRCAELDLDAVGLVVESSVQFPDPMAARFLIEKGVDPLIDRETDTETLIQHAEDIREQREALAASMSQADQESSSQAQPLGMFQ